MGITFSGQAGFLLTACLLGITLGAVYDIFRIIRVAFRCGKVSVFFQDIIFWIICAAATFIFLVLQNKGKVRVLMLFSEAGGAALYYCTIGAIVLRKVNKYDLRVKRGARKAAAAVTRPIGRFGSFATANIAKEGRHAGSFFKKETKLFKIRLQVNQRLMYNLIQATRKSDRSKK